MKTADKMKWVFIVAAFLAMMVVFGKAQTPAPSGGWNVNTLFTYFNTRLDAQKEALGIAQEASERALSKAEAAQEDKFKGLNELRGVVTDIIANLPSKGEVSALEKRIVVLENAALQRQGVTGGQLATWQLIALLIGIGGGLYGLVMNLKYRNPNKREEKR